MILATLLFVSSDITCTNVWLSNGSVNGTGFSGGNPPSGLTFSSFLQSPQPSGRVTLGAAASRDIYDEQDDKTGWGTMAFRLNSVNATAGPAKLTVWFQVGAQSGADGTRFHPGSNISSEGSTADPKSKISGRWSGNWGEYEKLSPNPMKYIVVPRTYNINWEDQGVGVRSANVFFLAEGLHGKAVATCTNGGTGNSTKATAHGSGSVKATFLKAEPTNSPSGSYARLQVTLDKLIPLVPYPVGSQPPGRVRSVEVRVQTANGSPVAEQLCQIEDTGPNTGLADIWLEPLNTGTYRVYLRTEKTLIKRFDVILQTGSVSIISNYSNRLGDVNQDNIIDSADTQIITKLLGVTSSSSRWYSPTDNDYVGDDLYYTGQDADLNGDGAITSADLAIAQANLGLVGD